MFSYKDHLYAIMAACQQQADLYGACTPENDYEEGFMAQVHDELLLLGDEIRRFLQIKEMPSMLLKTIFDDITQNKKSAPKQKAQDIVSLLIEKMDERRKLQPPFSYTQEDHDKGFERLFTTLEIMGHGTLSLPDRSKTVSKDFESFSRGVNEGADFAFGTVLPQIIKDYPDMVTLKISPYWHDRITHATAQRYMM